MRKELMMRLADIWSLIMVLKQDPKSEAVRKELAVIEEKLTYLIVEVDNEKNF
jgi:hypothetical protein